MPSRAFTYFYTAYTLVTAPVWLAAAAIYNIPKFLRPNAAWSWKTAFTSSQWTVTMNYLTTIQKAWPKSLEAGPLGNQFIVLNPQKTITTKTKEGQESTQSEVYKGITCSVPGVEPLPVGAVWFPEAPAEPPRRLIIHFYGSAYVMFGSRPGETGEVGINELSKMSGWPALAIQYRLSRDKKTTFPAALQDGMTAYVYALEVLKIPASQIVFAGDSAGGNLVVALLRYINEENPALPLPRCAFLSSPWVDLSTESIENVPRNRNYNADYVTQDFLDWGRKAYTPEGWDSSNSWITFLGNETQLGIPVFVNAGTSEVLYDDIMKFAENLRKKGNEVEVLETPNSCHVPYRLVIRLDTNQAFPDAINFCKNQSSSSKSSVTALRLQSETENIRIEGVKTAPRNIVKAFVDRDQDVKLLRERSESLQALPGVKLQREQRYPIKLDAVRKTDVFDDLGKEKSDF
ncbi:acetyl-hydrolase [Aspergillus awamori]|uniref:Acetyl-hydrolase n=1 Tax=Aspergillus awamori TaxID=105351 RepID=A0A401L678_ASPAW|nr:acetyl-hydrolase [Aspergillus awamori]